MTDYRCSSFILRKTALVFRATLVFLGTDWYLYSLFVIKSVTTDECTTNKLQMSYAIVLIEVDVTQKKRDVVVIKDHDDRKLIQKA